MEFFKLLIYKHLWSLSSNKLWKKPKEFLLFTFKLKIFAEAIKRGKKNYSSRSGHSNFFSFIFELKSIVPVKPDPWEISKLQFFFFFFPNDSIWRLLIRKSLENGEVMCINGDRLTAVRTYNHTYRIKQKAFFFFFINEDKKQMDGHPVFILSRTF